MFATPFAIFHGDKTVVDPISGVTRFEGYIAAVKKSYNKKVGNGNADTAKQSAAIHTALPETDGCLKVLSNAVNIEFETTTADLTVRS